MKPAYLFVVLMLMAGTLLGHAQSTAAAQTSPRLAVDIERDGDQLRLVLTNSSETRTFQGAAKVSLDTSSDTNVRLAITLAPGETRRLPLTGLAPSGNKFVLAVYNQTGALILYKITSPASAAKDDSGVVAEQKHELTIADGIRVNARLARNMANREAEIPMPDEVEPFTLTFAIESASPIKDASFSLSGKDFERRQPVTGQGHIEIAFKLPEALPEASSARQFSYSLIAATGNLLASGKVDLDQLAAPDAVTISEMTFDRPAYAPGETARATIELLGETTRGYRLEVTVQGDGGSNLFKDERKGVNIAGKSRQQFLFDLPSEVKGPITLSFRVFGGQTGLLFDSGVRQIILNEAPATKTSDGKRLAP